MLAFLLLVKLSYCIDADQNIRLYTLDIHFEVLVLEPWALQCYASALSPRHTCNPSLFSTVFWLSFSELPMLALNLAISLLVSVQDLGLQASTMVPDVL